MAHDTYTTLFTQAQTTWQRSLAKTISWRVLGSLDTFLISYIVTGHAAIGALIASAEIVTKMALYYLHERGWARVKWGAVRS